MERKVGNRRSEEELLHLQTELNKSTYKLEEQPNFLGTKEELEYMQSIERFYIDGMPKMSDEEWDLLKKKFNYKESLSAGSPGNRRWVKLLAPLPSIDKGTNFNEVESFISKFPNSKFKLTPKLDGLTANLRYKLDENKNNYTLEIISSRGNGRYGLELNEDSLSGVNTNIKNIIPKEEIEYSLYGSINTNNTLPEFVDIRGEAVIPKTDYIINKHGENAVLRSIAAGIFNRKIPFNVKGLYKYCYNKDIDIELDFGEIEIKELINMRLFASLISDKPLNKGSKVFINKCINPTKEYKYHINIIFSDGESFSSIGPEEFLDVIIFSISKDKLNYASPYLSKYFDTADKIKLKDKSLNYNLFGIYNNTKDIMKQVNLFYGCVDGVRNFNMPRLRNMYIYALDGLVINKMDSTIQEQGMFVRPSRSIGKFVIPKYPSDALAVKFTSEIVRVKLDKIEYKETELGNVTCQGILDKPYLTESGSLISSINLHNPEWLKENNWIQEGKEYNMIMSMDIIPVLLKE